MYVILERCQFLYHGGSWFAGYQGTYAQRTKVSDSSVPLAPVTKSLRFIWWCREIIVSLHR